MRISKLPLCAALGLLLVTGCAAINDDTTIGEAIDDSVITTKVKAALVEDEELSALEISVETSRGVVQLSGFVDDQSDIPRATQLAGDIDGVVSVRNSLILQ